MTNPDSVRSFLKGTSQPLHDLSDTAVSKSISEPTGQGYQSFLKCMHELYKHFGPSYDFGCQQTGLTPRAQTLEKSLKNDLQLEQNTAPSASTINSSPAYCIGVTYVLEGSAMGAPIILKRVQSSPYPARYSYLENVARAGHDRWKPFLLRLEEKKLNRDIALQGTEDVFKFILARITSERISV